MNLHANAKLGLAAVPRSCGGRGRDVAEGGSGRLQRLAGDRPPLVAPLAAGGREQAALARPLDRPPPLASAVDEAEEGPILRARSETASGPAALPDRSPRPFNDLEGAADTASLDDRAASAASSPLRMVAAGCPDPHRHRAAARFATPATAPAATDRELARPPGAGCDYLHCVVDDHSPSPRSSCTRARRATVAPTLERALRFYACPVSALPRR